MIGMVKLIFTVLLLHETSIFPQFLSFVNFNQYAILQPEPSLYQTLNVNYFHRTSRKISQIIIFFRLSHFETRQQLHE